MSCHTRTALVCEGHQGLGGLIAEALIRNGVRVIRASSDPLGAAQTDSVQLDFLVPASVRHCAEHLAAIGCQPDILVLNAPALPDGYSAGLDDAAWARACQLLWTGPLALVRRLLPGMLQGGNGRLIWLTSCAAHRFVAGQAIATSLQSGIHGLVRTLAAEYYAQGLTVNALIPTARSSRTALAGQQTASLAFARYVAFLASDAAAYVSGQLLVADVDAVP